MKHSLISLVFLLLILSSCERKEPFVYKYETNPQYTKGYVEFWGAYYSRYDNAQNVLSLSAFTDSLLVDDEGQLYGFGQYLYLEDIFLLPNDTVFSPGDYTVSDSGEAFTIAPGEIYKDKDDVIKDIGACIYFYEPVASNSIRKFIIEGKMTVSQPDLYTRIIFDFTLDDQTELKGSFYIKDLIYYDMSNFSSIIGHQIGRLKKVHAFSPAKLKAQP